MSQKSDVEFHADQIVLVKARVIGTDSSDNSVKLEIKPCASEGRRVAVWVPQENVQAIPVVRCPSREGGGVQCALESGHAGNHSCGEGFP